MSIDDSCSKFSFIAANDDPDTFAIMKMEFLFMQLEL